MPSAQLSTDLRRLNMSVRMGFMDAYNARSYTPRHPIFATTQQSSSAENIYPQIIDPAAIREWVGERVVNGLVINGARVANQTFELTYAVRRTDVEDDLTGTIAQAISRVRSGASKFVRHPDKLVMAVLTGNATCLDGLALFHATHKENPADAGSATFANTTNVAKVRPPRQELQQLRTNLLDVVLQQIVALFFGNGLRAAVVPDKGQFFGSQLVGIEVTPDTDRQEPGGAAVRRKPYALV